MKTIQIILVFFIYFEISSCKIKFTENDLISYNLYSINDTLKFKNDKGQINSYVIISKSIITKGWDANTGWYNPQVAYIKYKDLSIPDSIYYDNSFLTIYQDLNKIAKETIYFNGFLGEINRQNQKDKKTISYLFQNSI